jgi:DNA mismatch repair protein MutS
MSMDVLEKDGEVVFLKRVRPGPSDNSYGLHVAKLAGLPAEALTTAERILAELSGMQPQSAPSPVVPKPLAAAAQPLLFPAQEIIIQEIRRFPLEKSSPLEALNRIAKWKDELGREETT